MVEMSRLKVAFFVMINKQNKLMLKRDEHAELMFFF